MPLTPKGKEVLAAMTKEYGAKKAKKAFYASANKGTIQGVHHSPAENVVAFDDRALGETPPRIPIDTGHPKRDTPPSNPGSPKATTMQEGTDNPRETSSTKGPTPYATPPIMGNSGSVRHKGAFIPPEVDTFGDGNLVDLAPSHTRGIAITKNTESQKS